MAKTRLLPEETIHPPLTRRGRLGEEDEREVRVVTFLLDNDSDQTKGKRAGFIPLNN